MTPPPALLHGLELKPGHQPSVLKNLVMGKLPPLREYLQLSFLCDSVNTHYLFVPIAPYLCPTSLGIWIFSNTWNWSECTGHNHTHSAHFPWYTYTILPLHWIDMATAAAWISCGLVDDLHSWCTMYHTYSMYLLDIHANQPPHVCIYVYIRFHPLHLLHPSWPFWVWCAM